MEPFEYSFIFIIGIVFAFLDAFGMGANDVSNSFAPSVGSRSLTLGGAICIAIFTEFGGAVLLGASTTDTIKNGIISLDRFESSPDVLMLGFMCSLIGSSLFVMMATMIGWTVSSTHSIVGAVGGIGVATFGFGSLNWAELTKIFISWIAAPGLAGIIASIVFMVTKVAVLDQKDSLKRGIQAIPFYFLVALGITTFYVLNKAPKLNWDITKVDSNGNMANKDKVPLILGWTFGMSVLYMILCYAFLVPFLSRKLIDEEDVKWYHALNPWSPPQKKNLNLERELQFRAGVVFEDEKSDMAKAHTTPDDESNMFVKAKNAIYATITKGITTDVAAVQESKVREIHSHAQAYDSKTEYLFSFLQICTAAFASFAHGSNDVSNAAGPLAAIVNIYETGSIPTSNIPVPLWVLAFMGLAIDLGLVLLGYKIMSVMGNNITYQTPSRGFSMEFGAALSVVTASFLGIPVSTTHCIAGATIGVGLCNGTTKAVNWKAVSWMLFGWLLTLPIAGGIAGGIFKLIISAPRFAK